MKTIKLITAFILLLTLQFSCKESNNSVQVNNFKTPETFKDVSTKNLYKLSVPNYMTAIANLNDEASLQYGSNTKGMYVIVIDEPLSVFKNVEKSKAGYDFFNSTLENYRNIQLEDLKSKVKMLQQSEPELLTIDGIEAHSVNTDAIAPQHDEPISFFHTFIEHEENLFMIMAWTLQSEKSEYENDVKNIVKSFKIINK